MTVKKRCQRTVVIDGEKYFILLLRRSRFGNFHGFSYRIKGPGLDHESFTNFRISIDNAADRLVEKLKKSTFRSYLANRALSARAAQWSKREKEFRLHRCGNCKFGDRLALARGRPCCNYPGRVEIDLKTLSCKQRRIP